MKLKILADENIPYATEVFGSLGEVTLLSGRKITRETLAGVEALMARSITPVNAGLLEGSSVKFVGTATIGFDHVDTDYLASKGIAFSSAPGSNSNSVSEYIVSALLVLSQKSGKPLEGSSLAVVGVGNVGSKVVQKAEALGMQCFLNDPPKRRETGDKKYLPLNEAVKTADFVTLHVPLQKDGIDKTLNMADKKFFSSLKEGAVFLNTSRGQVVVEEDLREAIDSGQITAAVLDVWQNEPEINPEMVHQAALATPHIAGHSFDGKVNGTIVIYEALCRWMGKKPEISARDFLPPTPVPQIDLRNSTKEDEAALRDAVSALYDIRFDDKVFRDTIQKADGRGKAFDLLRKNYPKRREFTYTELLLDESRSALASKAKGLGFIIRGKND